MMSVLSTMREAMVPRGVLTGDERSGAAAARITRATADPMFPARVAKAAAKLRKLDTPRGRSLAAQFTDAVQVAQATGATLPTVLEDRGLLRRILG